MMFFIRLLVFVTSATWDTAFWHCSSVYIHLDCDVGIMATMWIWSIAVPHKRHQLVLEDAVMMASFLMLKISGQILKGVCLGPRCKFCLLCDSHMTGFELPELPRLFVPQLQTQSPEVHYLMFCLRSRYELTAQQKQLFQVSGPSFSRGRMGVWRVEERRGGGGGKVLSSSSSLSVFIMSGVSGQVNYSPPLINTPHIGPLSPRHLRQTLQHANTHQT